MYFEIDSLFAVPVYRAKAESVNFDKELSFLDSIEYKKGVSNSLSKSENIFEMQEFRKCKELLEEHLNLFYDNVFNCQQEIYITNSWIARTKPGESHHSHNHPNSIVSGVLYLRAEEGSSNLKFNNKSRLKEDFAFDYTVNQYNIFNSSSWQYKVETGDIIIFPSWLPHEVSENNSDAERIILGFNTFVRGEFGEETTQYSAKLKL